MMMKTTSKLTFILILFLLQTVLITPTAFANAEATGHIAGSVWIDANGNGVQELDELPSELVIVYVQAEGEEVIEGNITDNNGHFMFSRLPFGLYKVWSEDIEGNRTKIKNVGLNEVSGLALVELPMTPTADETGFQIFLPMITN